jgi:hypothetical protein
MRWSQNGAENLLRLRAVAENNDWEAYHIYRKQQRHLRLYGSLPLNLQPTERQSLASQTLAAPSPFRRMLLPTQECLWLFDVSTQMKHTLLILIDGWSINQASR